jgi:hypothetical protein
MKIGKIETSLSLALAVLVVAGNARAQTADPSFEGQTLQGMSDEAAGIKTARAAAAVQQAARVQDAQAPYDVDAVFAAGIHCEIRIFDSKSPLSSLASNNLKKYAEIRVALKTIPGTKELAGTYDENSYDFKSPVKFEKGAWPPSQEAIDQAVAGMQPANVSKPLSGLAYTDGEGSTCTEERFPDGPTMGPHTITSNCNVYPQVTVKGKGFELAFQVPHSGVWTRTSTTDFFPTPPTTSSNEYKQDVAEYVGPDGLVGSGPQLKTKLSRVKTGSGEPGTGEIVGNVLTIGNVTLAKALFGGGFGNVDQIGACHLDSN